jgi:predicted membrane-bound mannosyltransferase
VNQREFFDHPFRSPARCVFFTVLVALLLFTRLWDLGTKTMMHDELLFVNYTYRDLFLNWTYMYLPILHGPIMLQFQNLVFHVFGVSDYSARLGVAILGISSFFFLWKLRYWLGEWGTWFVLAFYVLSPGITFFQRFFHQDAMYLFCALWIICSLANWWRTRDGRWAASALIAATALFTNKASALFIYFSVITFVAVLIIHDISAYFFQGKANRIPEYLERVPKLPGIWLPALGFVAFVVLALTQTFEGIVYDGDVRNAIGHDWVLRDVRSIPILFNWVVVEPGSAPDAHGAEKPAFWLAFYGALLGGALLVAGVLHVAIRQRLGHHEVLVSLWRRVHAARYYLGAAACASLFLYLWIYTTAFEHRIGVFEIYARTWSYWGGQHEWGRIYGPFHQHGVNLLLYELPAVLLILGAWLLALWKQKPSGALGIAFFLMVLPVAAFHKLIFSGLQVPAAGGTMAVDAGVHWLRNIVFGGVAVGVILLIAPRAAKLLVPASLVGLVLYSIAFLSSERWANLLTQPIYRGGDPVMLATRHVNLKDFIEIQFNFDAGWNILLVMMLVFFATLYTWQAIQERRRFEAFCVWWFVTMFGSAAYAREAVPQVGIHVMLPAIVLAGIYLTRLMEIHQRFPITKLIGAGLLLAVLWNSKATFNLNFHLNDQPRERMAYGPASDDVKAHMDFIRAYHRIAGLRMEDGRALFFTAPNDVHRHKDVQVYIKQLDQVTWPAKWYLRHIEYTEGNSPDQAIEEGWDFLFLAVGDVDAYPKLDEKYHIHRGRGTTFWTPSPLDPRVMTDVWKQMIPGHYLDNTPQAADAYNSTTEWRLLWRYMLHREYFDGTNRPYPSLSSFEYLFCYRKDLL